MEPAKKAASKEVAALPHDAALLALEASYAEGINVPVATILLEAQELQGVLGKLKKRLLSGSRLQESLLDGLGTRIEALDGAEGRWSEHRTLLLAGNKKKLRAEAEELRSDAIAALRHFAPGAPRTQAQLDLIVEGSGIADLIEDLKKLQPLLRSHSGELEKAQLPPKAGERLLALARALEEASSEAAGERVSSDEARQALALRNRAYWWLREALDEIRECGRYVFRKEPDKARLFRSSYSRKNQKSPASKPAPAA